MTVQRHLRLLTLPALLASAALTGCSALPTTVFDGGLAMRDGWHRATVDHSVADAELPALLRPDCGTGAQADAKQRWALVDYRPGGRARRAAVPLAAGERVADGAPVYLQVQGCQRALAPRSQGQAARAVG